jgi:hypothetical protein
MDETGKRSPLSGVEETERKVTGSSSSSKSMRNEYLES